MAVATQAAGGHHESAASRLAMNRAGLWLFFFSESVIFGLLLTARFFLEGIKREELDQFLGLIITIVLLASSVSAYTAETAIEHGRRKWAIWCMLITILLGTGFAIGVGFEWSVAHFHKEEVFGTVFFTMTGIHAAHVVSGVGLLVLVLVQMLRGRFGPGDSWPVSATVMYWHFVDVVWVFFYPALYLAS